MSKKKIEEIYSWHAGQEIHHYMVKNKSHGFTLKSCAEKMGILKKKQSVNKLQKPHFGNIYELINISIIKKNFFLRILKF